MPKHAQIEVDDELYLARADSLLARLRNVDDGIDCALLLGHNPGLSSGCVTGPAPTRRPEQPMVTVQGSGCWPVPGPSGRVCDQA